MKISQVDQVQNLPEQSIASINCTSTFNMTMNRIEDARPLIANIPLEVVPMQKVIHQDNHPVMSTISKFCGEDFLLEQRRNLAANIWKRLCPKLVEATFEEAICFGDEIYKTLDNIQLVEKVDTSIPKQRTEQYLKNFKEFHAKESSSYSTKSRESHKRKLDSLIEKREEAKTLEVKTFPGDLGPVRR